MSSRPLISVVIGLLFALGALWAVYNFRGAPAAQAAPTPVTIPTVSVFVAKEDIPFGARIIPDMIATVQWPEENAPADAITSREELLNGPEGEERIALRSFVAGEPFLKQKISGYGERPTLSRRVTEGMRAVSIRINDVNGVAGFLLPGDRVDVLLTRELDLNGGRRDDKIVDVILQNVTVLGIDQMSSEEAEDPVIARTATVEVSPEDAQKLALAQQVGTLSLTLRNYANTDEAEVRRVTMQDLGDKKQVQRSQDNGIYVRVRKGTDVGQERVPN